MNTASKLQQQQLQLQPTTITTPSPLSPLHRPTTTTTTTPSTLSPFLANNDPQSRERMRDGGGGVPMIIISNNHSPQPPINHHHQHQPTHVASNACNHPCLQINTLSPLSLITPDLSPFPSTAPSSPLSTC